MQENLFVQIFKVLWKNSCCQKDTCDIFFIRNNFNLVWSLPKTWTIKYRIEKAYFLGDFGHIYWMSTIIMNGKNSWCCGISEMFIKCQEILTFLEITKIFIKYLEILDLSVDYQDIYKISRDLGPLWRLPRYLWNIEKPWPFWRPLRYLFKKSRNLDLS